MKIVVTGGAGYIGAHVAWALDSQGHQVSIIDDLSSGIASRVDGLPLHVIDLVEPSCVDTIAPLLNGVDAVAHFAARKSVADSVSHPAWYTQQNVGSLANVLLAVEAASVPIFLFSSSAAVYGATEGLHIHEDLPTRPINPYGETKLTGERLVAASTDALNLRSASLRYFNAAGTGRRELADSLITNLIPIVIKQVLAGEEPTIFGDDYPTADGTCVRDFIHILDLVDAHVETLDFLSAQGPGHHIFNVGTGRGVSVADVIAAVAKVSGRPISPRREDRRAGDPAMAVADPTRIAQTLSWQARRSLDDIVTSAWQAATGQNPTGQNPTGQNPGGTLADSHREVHP